jgi:type IV pilus assembly protein PilB
MQRIPKRMAQGVTTRLKVLAKLDIAERRKPQDGRISLNAASAGRMLDIRVAVLPTVEGECCVMRLIDKSKKPPTLESIGLNDEMRLDLEEIIHKPYGAVLVTGPTGSGKSTTLYAGIGLIASPDINVITVEDPVEYRMDGINQVPVNPKRGMTFAGALRSILRQDPDIIMIGEIRDTETAEIAVEAALTGHQVLSTMHCNDAPGAIARLDDMGIAPFLISSSVILACAQRLMRRICSHCKEPVTYPSKMYTDLNIDPSIVDGVTLFRGRGCERCKNSGYAGRLAIIEAMSISDEIRKLIIARANSREMGKIAIGQGMRTLRMVALDRVRDGVSTLEQVLVLTSGH